MEPQKRISWGEYFEHPFFRKKQDYKKYYKKGEIIGKADLAIIYKGEESITKEKKAIKIISIAKVIESIKINTPGIFKVTKQDIKKKINEF